MTDYILSSVTPLYGFCPFERISDKLIQCRALSRLPKNAKTVIVCVFPYYLGDNAYSDSDISKYAVVPDYHDLVLTELDKACEQLKKHFPDEEFVPFTDNSPVPEVFTAASAGLGVVGKNGLLITEEYGSWVFIGEIVTTKDYYTHESILGACIGCGKCVSACPTDSISKHGIIKESCLSDITQRKGELKSREKEIIIKTGCIWGCDICQNVCPMNKNVKTAPMNYFLNNAKLKADPNDLTDRAYAWRGKKVIERNYNLLYKENENETDNRNNQQ